MVSKEALEEFKAIYKKEYNEDISDEKAIELATNLLNVMNIVYRPIKKEWIRDLEEKDNWVNKAFDILFNEVDKNK